MSKTQTLRAKYKSIIEKNGGINYYERQKIQSELDPSSFDGNISITAAQAVFNANEFLSKLQTWDHPNHAEAIKTYSEDYGGSHEKVHQHHLTLSLAERAKQRIKDIEFAETEGRKNAKAFSDSLKDFNDPKHAESVAFFNDKLGSNPEEIEDYFIEVLYKKHKLTRVPVRDEAYEKSVTEGYKPASEFEKASLESLKDLFEQRFAAVGYKGSKADYEAFLSENISISGNPTFKPKA